MFNIDDELEELKKLKGKFKHLCPQFKNRAIDEFSPEFSICSLGKVIKDFKPKGKQVNVEE